MLEGSLGLALASPPLVAEGVVSLVSHVQAYAYVKVEVPFYSGSADCEALLAVGRRGVVVLIDADGDVNIIFELSPSGTAPEGRRVHVVFAEDFHKLVADG